MSNTNEARNQYTPYTPEHLQDRREALQRGRNIPRKIGQIVVAAVSVAAAIGALHFGFGNDDHRAEQNDRSTEPLRALVATPPEARDAELAALCRTYSQQELPAGMPDCDDVIGVPVSSLPVR